MATQFNVAGASAVTLGSDTVGYTVDGPEIETENLQEEVFADIMGTKAPADIQYMGAIAHFTFRLIYFDWTKLQSHMMGFAGTAAGATAEIGKLYFQQSGTTSLIITNAGGVTTPAPTFTFDTAIVRGCKPIKVGTKVTTVVLMVDAYITSDGGTLFAVS